MLGDTDAVEINDRPGTGNQTLDRPCARRNSAFAVVRLLEFCVSSRLLKPAIVGLTSDVEDPTHHRGRDPVVGKLTDERVDHFLAGSTTTNTQQPGAGPRSPAPAAGFGHAAHAVLPPRRRPHQASRRPQCGGLHPARQAGLAAPEISSSLLQLLPSLTVPGASNNVVAELLRIRLRPSAHPSSVASRDQRSDVTYPCSRPMGDPKTVAVNRHV